MARTLCRSAFVVLCISFIGCASVMEGLQDIITTPTARVAGVDVAGFDLQGVDLSFALEISNPYGVDLPLVDLGYGLAAQGRQFLSGNAPVTGSVPARGRKTIQLPLRVEFLPTLNALSGVRPGQVLGYEASMSLSVDPPVGERIALPLSHTGELPIPAVPSVALSKIQWSEVSLTKISGALHVDITNENEFPVDMSRFDWGLKLAGRDVASGIANEAMAFGANAPGQLVIPLELSPLDLGTATVRMLTGDGSGYELTGDMSVGTPFGALDLPFEKLGDTIFER